MITNKIHEKSEEYFEFLDLPVYPSVVHAAICDEETCRAVLQHNDAVFLFFFASAAHIAVCKRPPHNVSAETSDFGIRNRTPRRCKQTKRHEIPYFLLPRLLERCHWATCRASDRLCAIVGD